METLESAITAAGATPVEACTYSFPYTNVGSFITLSSVLEGVGTSAYLGGAPLITSKAYLTVAGAILATEALHTSYQRNAINEVPMANPFETVSQAYPPSPYRISIPAHTTLPQPLDPTSVYTLAAMFITSCPASNTGVLPFVPFPTLQADGSTCTCEEPDCSETGSKTKRWGKNGSGWPKTTHSGENQCSPPKAGQSAGFTVTTNGTAIPAGSYLTYVSGLSVVSEPGTISGTLPSLVFHYLASILTLIAGENITSTIPSVASGQTYVFVTKSDVEGTFDDTQVIAGPAVLEVYPTTPTLDYSEI